MSIVLRKYVYTFGRLILAVCAIAFLVWYLFHPSFERKCGYILKNVPPRPTTSALLQVNTPLAQDSYAYTNYFLRANSLFTGTPQPVCSYLEPLELPSVGGIARFRLHTVSYQEMPASIGIGLPYTIIPIVEQGDLWKEISEDPSSQMIGYTVDRPGTIPPYTIKTFEFRAHFSQVGHYSIFADADTIFLNIGQSWTDMTGPPSSPSSRGFTPTVFTELEVQHLAPRGDITRICMHIQNQPTNTTVTVTLKWYVPRSVTIVEGQATPTVILASGQAQTSCIQILMNKLGRQLIIVDVLPHNQFDEPNYHTHGRITIDVGEKHSTIVQ